MLASIEANIARFNADVYNTQHLHSNLNTGRRLRSR